MSGQCEKFVYGGCGGNENNYNTLEECELACEDKGESSDVDAFDTGKKLWNVKLNGNCLLPKGTIFQCLLVFFLSLTLNNAKNKFICLYFKLLT